MVETKVVIDTLRRLQEVDRKIAHIERMKAWEPRRLAEATAKASEAQEALAQMDKDHGDLQRNIARIELEIKTREEQIQKHKSQMLSASSNKQYQALLREISMEEVEKARIEEQLLEKMIQIDNFSEREEEAARALEEATGELEKVKQEVRASLEEISGQESTLREERRAIASELPADMLRHYERLFESRSGNAVVPANYLPGTGRSEGRYSCGGCNMSLTHQMVNLLLIGSEVVTCKSCGRILFLDEDSKEEQ